MPVSEVLKRLADAFVQRERMKLGIPAEERAATAASDESLLRRAQAARAIQEMGLVPQERAARLGLIGAQTDAANALAAKNRRPATSKQIERTIDLGNRVRTIFTDGTMTEEPKGAAPRAAGSSGTGLSKTGVQIIGKDGKPAVWFPPATGGALPEGSAFATDVRGERKAAVAATSSLTNVETLANQVEDALGQFENTNGLVHPIDKAVANSTYKNTLSALAVPWGRLLGDSRISDQDRTAYSRSVGEPSFFLREMAPEIARQRLTNLRKVIAEIRAKYGAVLEDTQGMLAPVGGGANLLGSPQVPARRPAAPAAAGGAKRIVFDAQGNVVR